MDSEAPAVARRRLRLAIRRLREAMGWTQLQVAEALDWSLSKVSRVESGDVTVSTTDLLALLGLFKVTDAPTVHRMTADAKAARRRSWWLEPELQEHLTPATVEMFQLEAAATKIRTFQPVLIPGLLQTREYADSILGSLEMLTNRQRDARLQARLRRTARVLDRPDPPGFSILLDESVLLRERPNQRVMHDQLLVLAKYNRRANVAVRIVPLRSTSLPVVGTQFTLLEMGEDESEVLYQEFYFHDELIETPAVVQRYRQIFESAWNGSLTEHESTRLLEARIADLATDLATDLGGP